MEVPAAPNEDDNNSTWKIQMFEGVDFFSCCRLCVTSYDQENRTPIFDGPDSLISSKIKKLIPLEIADGDGLPDSICKNCVGNLNYIHNFIEKSLAADKLLRIARMKARAANVMSRATVIKKVDENNVISTQRFEKKSISSLGKPISFDSGSLEDIPFDFYDEPVDFPSNPAASKSKSLKSSGPCSKKTSVVLGDHSYCVVLDLPADPSVSSVVYVEKDQSLAVPKIAKPNHEPKSKSDNFNIVNSVTHQKSLELPMGKVLSGHTKEKEQATLEPEIRLTICDSTLKLLNANDDILGKTIIRKKINPKQQTNKKKVDRKPRLYEPVKSVFCEVCKKEFTRRSCLRDHMYTHTGERPFACETCGKAYPRRYEFKKHVLTHTESTEVLAPFVCDICGRRHTSASKLRNHMVSHSKNRPFACTICNKGFKHKMNIRKHMVTHNVTENVVKPFECSFCGANFIRKRPYSFHLAKHTKAPTKVIFKCHLCSDTFQEKSMYNIHMETHERKSPDYECSHCKKWFYTQASVDRHIQDMHVRKKDLQVNKKMVLRISKVFSVNKNMPKMSPALSEKADADETSANVSQLC